MEHNLIAQNELTEMKKTFFTKFKKQTILSHYLIFAF